MKPEKNGQANSQGAPEPGSGRLARPPASAPFKASDQQHTRQTNLPSHVEQSVRAIAKLHSDHREAATAVQRAVELAVAFLGSPGFLAVLAGLSVGWVVLSLLLLASGASSFDAPPFPYLALVSTLTSLGMMVLILMTQRRDDELASRREQMTLELAILSEQKLAKVIELLEESRRDNPLLSNRVDPSAEAMAEPADPDSLGEAIKRNEEK